MAEEEMLKVADVHEFRHLVLAEGVSQREVARRFGTSRNTVTRYLDQRVVPGTRVEGPRARPAQDVFRGPVVHILETAHVTRKQRLTAARLRAAGRAGHPGRVRSHGAASDGGVPPPEG